MFVQPHPNLAKPLRLRKLLLKNRIMSAPNMLTRTIDGKPDEYYVRYLEHKARGGAAIVTLGEANVCDGGNHAPGMVTSFENMAIFAEMAQAIHEHGAVASVELTHGGMHVHPAYNSDPKLLLSPSGGAGMQGAKTRAMTASDMEYVAQSYADTAEYYIKAGFDTVLVHLGHGWLISQFLSPIHNRRNDEYGGSLGNRMRFPLYVLQTIRRRLGPDRAILGRLSGSENRADGFTPDDMAEFLSHAQEYIDMVEVSADDFAHIFASPYTPWGQNVEFAEVIRKTGKVKIPMFTVGSILDPAQAEALIASGVVDGVSMSRALLADPYLPKKAFEGRADELRPCIRCLNCTESNNSTRHLVCTVNPLIAREARLGFGEPPCKTTAPKRVLIVGGGPAGLQAAITATECGHTVTLAEKSAHLGGMLRFTDTDVRKTDLRRYKQYLVHMAESCGAEILLNTAADDALMERVAPDTIIVATGSRPAIPTFIKGYECACHATEVYLNPDFTATENVVVIGGGLIGLETALHLASLGRRVTVLEMSGTYAADTKGTYRMAVMHDVERLGVEVITNAQAVEITEKGVAYKHTDTNGDLLHANGDTVLYAIGMQSENELYDALCTKAPDVRLVGDALRVGKVDGAIHDGFFAARSL